MEENERYPSLKAIIVFEELSRNHTFMGINEICAATGYSQSTVHRLLSEMTEAGFVEKSEKLRKYRTGMRANLMFSSFMSSSSLIASSREEMVRLNDISGETIHLMSLSEQNIIYINKVNTTHTLGLMSHIGKTNPIYCTSGGKAIAAYKGEAWVSEYLRSSVRIRFTENTIVDEDEFLRELAWIREHGYALDRCEHHKDVVCVAAPIFSLTATPVASISISGPAYRFSLDKAQALAEEVKLSAQVISRKMGT